jgi:hypothetical protein
MKINLLGANALAYFTGKKFYINDGRTDPSATSKSGRKSRPAAGQPFPRGGVVERLRDGHRAARDQRDVRLLRQKVPVAAPGRSPVALGRVRAARPAAPFVGGGHGRPGAEPGDQGEVLYPDDATDAAEPVGGALPVHFAAPDTDHGRARKNLAG